MKHKLARNSYLIAIAGSWVIAVLYLFGVWNTFENRGLDLRFKIRGTQESQQPIVVAAIDDESLEVVGKWPWPRKIHGKLVEICKKAGAKAIVFDVLFLEPDRYEPANDQKMGEAYKKSKIAVSAFNFKLVSENVVEPDAKGRPQEKTMEVVFKEEPIPAIANSAKALGFVNTWQDEDGYLRRAYLTFDLDGETYYPLSLQAVAVATGKSAEEILNGMRLSDAKVWGKYAVKEALINWKGKEEGTFERYSCAKILDPSIPMEWKRDWLKDKIIFFGSTALGLYDHYPTPFSPQLPGVYKHVNIADNLLSGEFLIAYTGWPTMLLVFLFGALSGFLVYRFPVGIGTSAVLSIGFLYSALAYFLMAKRLIVMDLVTPLLSLCGNYILPFFYRFVVEQKEKAEIKKAFGVYVNPHVAEQIAKNPDALKLGGEMREMTVMFSDVAGFTTISEKLSPEELVHLLNLYLTAMTDTIMKYDGTVDKYEGDAIMAFWGAPLLQPDHAKQACLAVLENKKKLAELNQELEKQGLQQLNARCGLNTGPMNVGNMGSSQKFNYTVMGDAVNLASRLEGANKQYHTNLMISETTYEQAKNAVEVRELDLLRVKGKTVPIKVYELVALKGELTDAQKRGFEFYQEGLSLYRKRDFAEALKKFQQVQELLNGDGPTETYLQRTKAYLENPPPEDWDGVFVMTTK